MGVFETILKRRTIRRFKQEPVPFQTLKKLADAGRLAPSGANLQPCEFIAVDDPEVTGKIFTCLKWAAYIAPYGDPPPDLRPVAYIIISANSGINKAYERDCAAAIVSMILTALEQGLGSCWMGSVNREKIREILSIPAHMEIDSVIALGYPAEDHVPEDLPPGQPVTRDSIKYYKDNSGRLHVPKRNLQDLLHHNRY